MKEKKKRRRKNSKFQKVCSHLAPLPQSAYNCGVPSPHKSTACMSKMEAHESNTSIVSKFCNVVGMKPLIVEGEEEEEEEEEEPNSTSVVEPSPTIRYSV